MEPGGSLKAAESQHARGGYASVGGRDTEGTEGNRATGGYNGASSTSRPLYSEQSGAGKARRTGSGRSSEAKEHVRGACGRISQGRYVGKGWKMNWWMQLLQAWLGVFRLGWFQGLRGTGDWGTDERPKSFREMIL